MWTEVARDITTRICHWSLLFSSLNNALKKTCCHANNVFPGGSVSKESTVQIILACDTDVGM